MGTPKSQLTYSMKTTILIVLIAAFAMQSVAAAKPAKKGLAVKISKKVSAACKLAVSKNGRCGKAFGNTRCTKAGVYCSKWNWCGTSALHKRTHQAKYDGRNCGKKVMKIKVRVVKKAKKVVKAKKAKKVVKAKKAKKAVK